MKRTIFLMLAVLLSTLSASAYDFKVDGIAYRYDKNYIYYSSYYEVVDGSDQKNAISIPSRVTYEGYTLPVTKISSQAFKDYTNLTSISIPSTITSISSTAFSGCTGLTSVTFNATNCSSSSSDEWFQDCPLTSLVIGNDVKSIPNYLAYNQTKLKTVTIGNSVTEIGKSAFSGCTSLTSVTFNATNCSSPSSSSSAWFQDCPLTSLVIGNDVKSIPGYLAYNQTKLKKVTIPNSVTSIGSGAFFACSNLKYMQLMCTTPPSISSNSIPSGTVILVPAGAYDAYKKDKNWSRYTLAYGYVAMGNDKGGGSFGGSGSGTKADPYLIFNPIQLHNIRNFTGYDDVYFKLMSDIDLTEFIDDNSPTEGWEPIGSVQSPFMGNLDGDGHTISGIRIDRKADCVGFFSCVKNANISNLKIEGTTIKGNSHVGAFIGAADNSVINGVSASFNNVDGQKITAGLIGSAQDGCHITSTQYAGAVNVAGDNVGGLVSLAYDNVSISKSTVKATSIVGKGDYVGGLVGFSFESNYTDNSISANLISGSLNYTGGAIGFASGMTASNSYAFVSSIKGRAYTGGFVGKNVQNSDKVSNCGVVANVAGTEYVGGFNGSFNGTANNVFAIGDIASTNSYCGGIAGQTTDASISNSYFSGNINGGGNYVGGIAGYSEATAISKNYSCAAINGLQYVGGIAGNALGNSTIKSNVAAGEVVNAVNGKVGRVFGEKASTVTIGASGTSDSNRGLTTMRIVSQGLQITPTDGEQHGSNLGKTLLKYKTTYQGLNWDFTTDWTILDTESFPYKPAQCAPPTFNGKYTAGTTTISGNSVEGGTVYVMAGGKTYSATVENHKWTVTVDPLLSGETVKAYATITDKVQSYSVTSIVGYAGGGTEEDPYQIYTASDLANINSYSYYKLMNDIDLTDYINANNPAEGWQPIGFTGGGTMKQLDGDGHLIKGLWFSRGSNQNCGLVSNIENATVKNLRIKIASGKECKGGQCTGIAVGKASNCALENIVVEGAVRGADYVGGVIGKAESTTVTNVTAKATKVTGTNYVGGIAGKINADATQCAAEVTITGSDYVGGIAGDIQANATQCSAEATIKGGDHIGGIAGQATGNISLSTSKGDVATTDTINCRAGGIVGVIYGNLTNCFSVANVKGGIYAGGVAGYSYGATDKCYASGNIASTNFGAGVVGYLDGAKASVNNCFAINNRIDVSDQSGVAMRVIGGFKNNAATPQATNFALKSMAVSVNDVTQIIYDDILEGKSVLLDALMKQTTYKAQGWDFADTWAIKEGTGYPYLQFFAQKKPVESITLSMTTAKMKVGEELTLTATITPDDATNKELNWTTSNGDAATVDENGKVSAVGTGTATITATATDGSGVAASCEVTVTEKAADFKMGDVNGDGVIDVSDVLTTASYAIGNESETFNFDAADVNKDGDIDVSDVLLVANIAIGKEANAALAPRFGQSHDALHVADFTLNRGEEKTIAVEISNTVDFSAFQMNMHLPYGVSLKKAALTSRATEGHAVMYNEIEPGNIAMIAFAASTENFYGNDGAVLMLTLKADNNFCGDGAIEFTGIKLAESDGYGRKVDNTSARISGVTGVDGIYSDARAYAEGHAIVIESATDCKAQIALTSGVMQEVSVKAGRNTYHVTDGGIYIIRIAGRTFKVII